MELIQGAFSTLYYVERNHRQISGTMPVPVAGPSGTPCQFINLFAPYEVEEVRWLAVKEGTAPTVPSFTPADSNHIFLWGERSASFPMIRPSGVGHLWGMWGVYVYGLTIPIGLDSDMATGSMPFDGSTVPLNNTIPAANFSDLLLAASSLR